MCKVKIDKDMQLEFMKFLFEDKGSEEYITIYGIDKKDNQKSTTKHFKTINGAIRYINKIKYNYDVYVSLATTDGTGRSTDNLISRNVLAFDFDTEGIDIKEIIKLFKKIGLYYHVMIKSGHGFHVYIKTERTESISELVKINSIITAKLGADLNSCKVTQILRVPDTFNYKDKEAKRVIGIWISEKIRNYTIAELISKYKKEGLDTYNTLKFKNMPYCIEEILKGVSQGDRNFCLGRLTKYFQIQGKTYEEANRLLESWNTRNTPPLAINELNKCFKKYWEGPYQLMGCICQNPEKQTLISKYCDKASCSRIDKYERVYEENEELIAFTFNELKLVNNRKKNGIVLNGNHLVISSILKNSVVGLTYKELEGHLINADTNKSCCSRPTILKVIKELESIGMIKKIYGNRKTICDRYQYVQRQDHRKIMFTKEIFKRYINGDIDQTALKIYLYMKYRLAQSKNVVEGELAEDLRVSQQAISKVIRQLANAGYLKIHVDYTTCRHGANVYEFMY